MAIHSEVLAEAVFYTASGKVRVVLESVLVTPPESSGGWVSGEREFWRVRVVGFEGGLPVVVEESEFDRVAGARAWWLAECRICLVSRGKRQ